MERKPEEISFYSPGERLFLLYDYLLKNTNREYVVTPKQINNFLNDHGIFLEKKAIYADFEKLRSATGLEIVWNAHKQGYQILNPPFEPYELRLMVDSIQASKFITQTEARRISQKITGLADVHTKASLDRQSYVSNRIRNREDSVVKDTDKIHACIRDDRKVAFRYFHYTPSKQRQFSKKGDFYIVSPFAMLWNDGNYYLYAYVTEKQSFRHFRVDRMERIEQVEQKRDGKTAFHKVDLTARQTKVFNMFSTGREYTVRLRCINRMADAIIDRFGKDTILMPDGENHFIVSVPVEVSEPFYAWVCSFGRRIRIVSPEPVVEEMKEFIGKIAGMYEERQEV